MGVSLNLWESATTNHQLLKLNKLKQPPPHCFTTVCKGAISRGDSHDIQAVAIGLQVEKLFLPRKSN
jgi:hypothetical protein